MKCFLVLAVFSLSLGFYTPHSGPWNNFGSKSGSPPVGALGNPWAESYPGPLGAWANGFNMGPYGFNPWMMAGAQQNTGDQSSDSSKDASDYWKVPDVAGWIVPNNPDALTPWGVNIADAIPVMNAPEKRQLSPGEQTIHPDYKVVVKASDLKAGGYVFVDDKAARIVSVEDVGWGDDDKNLKIKAIKLEDGSQVEGKIASYQTTWVPKVRTEWYEIQAIKDGKMYPTQGDDFEYKLLPKFEFMEAQALEILGQKKNAYVDIKVIEDKKYLKKVS